MTGWWRQTDQFDWFSVYLHDRGLQLQWRLATFVFTAMLGALPLVMLGSPLGPDNSLTTGIAIAAGVWVQRRLAICWSTRVAIASARCSNACNFSPNAINSSSSTR